MPYNFVLTFWNLCTNGHTEQLKQWQLRDSGMKYICYYLNLGSEIILIIQSCFCDLWHLANWKKL